MTVSADEATRPILILGRRREVAQGIARQLRERGIEAVTSTDPEQAAGEFTAGDYRLIVFGNGVVGPVSMRLRREFTEQDPTTRFLDAFAPFAIGQIVRTLDPTRTTAPLLDDFRMEDDGTTIWAKATVRTACLLRVDVYKAPVDDGWDVDFIAEVEVQAGSYETQLDANYRGSGFTIVATAADEIYLDRFSV
ncbi:MAG: hypothetical protein QOH06_6316 [Acidobacteriota bacterium]|jgi:hypothetical protein|nr:hypothetical protein [Acidobacteriota bacterium]